MVRGRRQGKGAPAASPLPQRLAAIPGELAPAEDLVPLPLVALAVRGTTDQVTGRAAAVAAAAADWWEEAVQKVARGISYGRLTLTPAAAAAAADQLVQQAAPVTKDQRHRKATVGLAAEKMRTVATVETAAQP